MSLWLILLLSGMAGARTWRLLVLDEIGEPVRKVFAHAPDWMQRGYWCPFCGGYWLTAAWLASGLEWGDHRIWQLLAGSLALNYAFGHANSFLEARE